MSTATTISWTDATWNPVRGCSRVSPGCDHCYAMGQAHRFSGPGGAYEGLTVLRPKTAKRPGVDWAGRARLVPEMLGEPLKWRKPLRIFVNSMSDLFHESLPDSAIDAVFGVMWACLYLGRDAVPGHVFQVLTKRPRRAVEYFAEDRRRAWADAAVQRGGGLNPDGIHDQVMFHTGPHPRIWLGVSAENQETADERIPLLLKLPAAVRFVSAEPLLGPLDLRPYLHRSRNNVCPRCLFSTNGPEEICPNDGALLGHDIALDWVIVGGESGNGARTFDAWWAVEVIEQCKATGVACFVKQLGTKPLFPVTDAEASNYGGRLPLKLSDKKGGDMSEWFERLRVRQFPEVRR